jgi:hypothetical protein
MKKRFFPLFCLFSVIRYSFFIEELKEGEGEREGEGGRKRGRSLFDRFELVCSVENGVYPRLDSISPLKINTFRLQMLYCMCFEKAIFRTRNVKG